MRRSRSFSNIPIPIFKRVSSNENIINSHQKPQPGLRRSNSSNFLSVPKSRYSSRDSLQSSSGNSRITATPLSSVGIAGTNRRITAAPSSSSKVAQSPYVLLKTNQINDKKFSSDQYRKICQFMQDRVEDFDPKSLKPLTSSSFVTTISMLFTQIDPRIKIDMTNYKEVVLKYLKLYRYPGPVSMSLLKSVNTNISWTQVMSIFGWLVDLFYQLRGPKQENTLEEYLLCKARNAVRSGPETKGLFIELVEKKLNFDKAEAEIFKKEVEKLRLMADDKQKLMNERTKQEDMLSVKLEQMKSEIKEFKEDDLEQKIQSEMCYRKAEIHSRGVKIAKIKESNNEKRDEILKQKYSKKEMQELLQKLENKKYSLSLKNEELEKIMQLKDESDFELTNSRRRIEAKIHEINSRLALDNLENFLVDTQNIRLPDRGINKPTFSEELEKKKKCLENIHEKIHSDIQEVEKLKSDSNNKLDSLCNQIEKINNKNNLFRKDNERISNEIQRIQFEFNVLRKQIENKMENIKKQSTDVESLKKKKLELQQEILVLRDTWRRINKELSEISKSITEETEDDAIQMKTLMEKLFNWKLAAYQKKLDQQVEIDDMLRKKC